MHHFVMTRLSNYHNTYIHPVFRGMMPLLETFEAVIAAADYCMKSGSVLSSPRQHDILMDSGRQLREDRYKCNVCCLTADRYSTGSLFFLKYRLIK